MADGASQEDIDRLSIQHQIATLRGQGEIAGCSDPVMNQTMARTMQNMSGEQLAEFSQTVRQFHDSGAYASGGSQPSCPSTTGRGQGSAHKR
ncbi:MAG: hypothetical protein K2Q12_04295 [Rickettsiales bacterium]|nr:hypothetical protein [Rickettsiales bacterium]